MADPEAGLYIVLVSVHGLIRGENLELGRDADTGGQTKYVVELARALGAHPAVRRVDLLTRQIIDDSVADDYARPSESLADNVSIIRIPCGPEGYLPKEQLWDHLDSFADNASEWLREQAIRPDLIHSHYADAGYVGSLLSRQLAIPLIHTGHSLGRSKRKRLMASGVGREEVERLYNMRRRIDAEELALATAECVITSTHQEIEEQYGLYDYYRPEMMRVVPPGTDLELFHPPDGSETGSAIARELGRFLRQPDKPIILAISRPDRRKNISSLLAAYGESPELQEKANLVIVAGNRDDLHEMDEGSSAVLTDILYHIDLYDLYGKVAYPKHHTASDVPVLYRLAAASKGVFINPALTEPFGLTLIEAAASGVPIVATEDGGPRDIIGNCRNGFLINPLDTSDISRRLLEVLNYPEDWQAMASNGMVAVKEHYSWKAHVERYLDIIAPVLAGSQPLTRLDLKRRDRIYRDRALFSDIDQTLLGDDRALQDLAARLKQGNRCCSFGIATGRRLDSALKLLRQTPLPKPDVLITSLGTEIYYGHNLVKDTAWTNYIDHLWRPARIRKLLADLPGLTIQPRMEQSDFKLSWYYDGTHAPGVDEINHLLLKNDIAVNCVLSFGQFLDIVPQRASKGLALRWYAEQWGLPLDHILVAGGSGADEDMLRGNTLGVVVANRHNEELQELGDHDTVYFARQPFAGGIIEAIEHYDFYGSCEVPS